MAEESKKIESKASEPEISKDVKNLIIARLEILSPDKKFSIGSSDKDFSRDELIESVKDGDEIGQKVIDLELTFLRALKDGTLLSEVLASEE